MNKVWNSKNKVGNSKIKVGNSKNKVENSRIKLVIKLRRFAILGPYYASCLYITVNIPSKLNDNVT